MPDYPGILAPPHLILPINPVWSVGTQRGAIQHTSWTLDSTGWGTNNLLRGFPVNMLGPGILRGFAWYNGGTLGANVDCALLDYNYNVVSSTGSTAQSGTSAWQSVMLTTPLLVPAGQYFCTLSLSASAGRIESYPPSDAATMRGDGFFQMASAFPTPDPVVPAAYAAAHRARDKQTRAGISGVHLSLL